MVTEYGVADLRGQSDSDVIKRLINIADSRFQDSLLEFGKVHNKLPPDYQIPAQSRNNTPALLQARLEPFRKKGISIKGMSAVEKNAEAIRQMFNAPYKDDMEA